MRKQREAFEGVRVDSGRPGASEDLHHPSYRSGFTSSSRRPKASTRPGTQVEGVQSRVDDKEALELEIGQGCVHRASDRRGRRTLELEPQTRSPRITRRSSSAPVWVRQKKHSSALPRAGWIKRRARAAGLPRAPSCHTIRATGITAYLENGGTIENAQVIAAHESPRTTKLYDRTSDEITLDEVERITI